MVLKGILITLIIVLCISISLDIYYTQQVNRDSDTRLNYLETIISEDDLKSYYNLICNSYTRPFLWNYYYRFLDLDPSKISIDKPFNWQPYIDKEDLVDYSKSLNKIPHLKNASDNRINKVRNKLVLSHLLNYAAAKLGAGGGIVCCGGYGIIKDVFNNITLIDYCGFINEEISINGTIIDDRTEFPLALPIADKLEIERINYRSNGWPENESICTYSTIDLKSLLN